MTKEIDVTKPLDRCKGGYTFELGRRRKTGL